VVLSSVELLGCGEAGGYGVWGVGGRVEDE